jgi:hypothetical protein
MDVTFGSYRFVIDKEGSYRFSIPIFSGAVPASPSNSGSLASCGESSEEEISTPSFGALIKKSSGRSNLPQTEQGEHEKAKRVHQVKVRSSKGVLNNFLECIPRNSAWLATPEIEEEPPRENGQEMDDGVDSGTHTQHLLNSITTNDPTLVSHQILVIQNNETTASEASELFEENGNPIVDLTNLNRGMGPKYETNPPRVRSTLSPAAWARANQALTGELPLNAQSTAEELTAYQYRLARAAREMQKQKEELDKRKVAADNSSKRRAGLSAMSGTSHNNGQPRGHKSRPRMPNIPANDRVIRDLDMSFMTMDTRGRLVPKTPEAAYIAAHTYMMATKPTEDDPRYSAFQTAMAGMGMIGAVVADKGSTPRSAETPRQQNSPRHGAETAARRSRSPRHQSNHAPASSPREPTAQQRVDRAREERDMREFSEDDMCGVHCFT